MPRHAQVLFCSLGVWNDEIPQVYLLIVKRKESPKLLTAAVSQCTQDPAVLVDVRTVSASYCHAWGRFPLWSPETFCTLQMAS